MTIRFTGQAHEDLAAVLAYSAAEYPELIPLFEAQLVRVIGRLAMWPESARPVEGYAGVRVIILGRFPYRLFYRLSGDALEILHISHQSRKE